jgi:hypothetical protein
MLNTATKLLQNCVCYFNKDIGKRSVLDSPPFKWLNYAPGKPLESYRKSLSLDCAYMSATCAGISHIWPSGWISTATKSLMVGFSYYTGISIATVPVVSLFLGLSAFSLVIYWLFCCWQNSEKENLSSENKNSPTQDPPKTSAPAVASPEITPEVPATP